MSLNLMVPWLVIMIVLNVEGFQAVPEFGKQFRMECQLMYNIFVLHVFVITFVFKPEIDEGANVICTFD